MSWIKLRKIQLKRAGDHIERNHQRATLDMVIFLILDDPMFSYTKSALVEYCRFDLI